MKRILEAKAIWFVPATQYRRESIIKVAKKSRIKEASKQEMAKKNIKEQSRRGREHIEWLKVWLPI